ncbi:MULTISPECIES: energy transducer TonB [Shewanella]|uniref:energy transducer TonB n=1 Tax=Shewanella TaxID=22 RepID=UPI0006972EAA|nr:energy transducer TonB [Shewanella algae]NJI87102.1 energy transducer TonB [Shewanella sp. Iso12]MBO2562073.1 energy transducer TonB [Shewanella algae]MBO2579085.1 energy transducer TonB [Shewanella algae]MBO2587728.1 energy transducer TonB [Shewanella algae]MBO2604572.1 energy transducer TonB [Shewanella algae]
MRKLLTILLCSTLISCASTQQDQIADPTVYQQDQITDPTVYQQDQVDAPTHWMIQILPMYPKKAAEEKVEGWVTMSAVITENGKVTEIQVLGSQPKGVFEKEAKRAFGKWLYKPALLNGKTVKVYQEETVEFKI